MKPSRHISTGAPPGGALILLAALVVGGCDIPTGLPEVDNVWETLLLKDSIAVNDLLPDDVRPRGSGSGFVLDRFASTSEVRLEEVCPLCTCFEGPIPPLEIQEHDWRVRLPNRVLEVAVTRGTMALVLHNQVGFDLLDDGEGGSGFLQVALTERFSDDVLDSVRVDGSFPPGDSLVVSFDLAGRTLNNRLVARVHGQTPGSGCDVVPLTPESGFRAEVRLDSLEASSVVAFLADADLNIPERSLDIPTLVANRLRPGEARASLEVRVRSSVRAEAELGLSVARTSGELFTDAAALYTPMLVAPGTPVEPTSASRLFLVDLEPLNDADSLIFSTRNRFIGDRRVRFRGGESVAYEVRLQAELPSR